MAKKADGGGLENLKGSKLFKSIGVKDIVQNGAQVSLMIDPAKLSPNVRKSISAGIVRDGGLDKAAASTLYQSPFEASTYEYMPLNISIHDKMRLAMMHFKTDPLVGKIIELMTTFSNDGFKNEHSNPKIKKFFDEWGEYVSLNKVRNWIFLELYRSGNVTTWRSLAPFGRSDLKIDSVEDPPYEANAAKKHLWTKKTIPCGYTVLNPLTVYVNRLDGYSDYLSFHPPITDNKLVDGFSLDDTTNLILKNLPREFEEVVKKNKGAAIPLPEKNIRRILRMRQPYEPYGSIMMERAFAAIHEKNKLRQMDLQMANSVINQIIKVTIGSDDFPATKPQLEKLANSFRNIGKSQTIFWNHTLNIEVIRPDTSVLNSTKYERVNEDIRNAFGIAEILTGGGAGSKANFATAYLSLKAFIANLMDGRKEVLDWIRNEYEDIAEAMGFDSYPEPSFNPLSLTDEIAEKQLIMQLIDRQVISYETAVDRLGYDYSTELKRKTMEQPLVEAGLMGIVGGPYNQTAQQTDENGAPISDPKQDKAELDLKKKILEDDSSVVTLEKTAFKTNMQNAAPNPTKTSKRTVNGPGIGDAGRPSTPKGNYPQTRKIAKIKGQGSTDQLDIFEEQQDKDMATVLAVVSKFEKEARQSRVSAA